MNYQNSRQNPNEVREGYIAWGNVYYSVDEFHLLLMNDCTQTREKNFSENIYSPTEKSQAFGAKSEVAYSVYH
jgi:hypothetical protein